jgi:hypothetical protein
MIEINLLQIPAGEWTSTVGKCIARNRFDKDAMGVTIEEFARGFLKDNLEKFESGIGSSELVETINSTGFFSRKDLACINYYLSKVGYRVKIFNVTDDEVDATGVPSGEIVEWNVIDHNFLQYDYPTAIKIIPGEGLDIPGILHQVVDQTGVFDPDKFAGLKNPFTELLNALDSIKSTTGAVNSGITTRIYGLLDEVGIELLCLRSED